MEDQLLTMKEVCSKLKISRYMVYQLLKEGKLSAYSIAGSAKATRYKKNEVDQLVTKIENIKSESKLTA